MSYYSRNYRPSSLQREYEREYLNRPQHTFHYYPIDDDLEKRKQEDIERFKETFQELFNEIQSFLYITSNNIAVKDMIENHIDIYNGHGEKNDSLLLHFLGFKKKNTRKNYNFYLKDYYIDSMYNDLRISIVGYVWNQEYEMSLSISQDVLNSYNIKD